MPKREPHEALPGMPLAENKSPIGCFMKRKRAQWGALQREKEPHEAFFKRKRAPWGAILRPMGIFLVPHGALYLLHPSGA